MYKKLFLGFLFFSSFGVKANGVPNFSGRLKDHASVEAVVLDEGTNHSFDEKWESLADMNLQMSSQIFSTLEFSDSEYSHLDVDGFHSKMHSDDRIFFAKTAFLFPGVRPSYFSKSKISSPAYIKRAMPENTTYDLDPKDPSVILTTRFFGISGFANTTIASRVHVSHYDFDKNEGDHLDPKTAQTLRDLNHLDGRQANFITTTYSGASDISMGSWGARTINFYYDINGKDTLHVSHKFVTFDVKKLQRVPIKILGGFTKEINVWSYMKDSVIKTQQEGTRISLSGVRSFVLDSKN